MNDFERGRSQAEIRRRRLNKLGVANIACMCGETDPSCIEAEHPFRRAHDGTVWGVCANCHRKKSEWERANHPAADQHVGNPFAKLAHQLLGSAYYLRAIAETLETAGRWAFRLAELGLMAEE